LNLVLNEGANLVHPEDSPTNPTLLREGVRYRSLVIREAGKVEGADTIGVICPRAPAQIGNINPELDVVVAVSPAHNIVNLEIVFRIQ
jgi:hypothetical protein